MIYITIPVHDEERTIGVLLWKIRKVMSDFGRPYEVLVLDDVSRDGTSSVLRRYEALLPLRPIRSDSRLGYGSAIERLLREVVDRSAYPKRDVVVTLQGDFSDDPSDLVGMVKTIEGGADLVAGIPADQEGVPASIKISRWLAPVIMGRAFSASPVRDPLSGFRAYRVIVLKKAFRAPGGDRPLIEASGWAANFQLLARAAPHARRIEEAAVVATSAKRQRESRFRALPSLRGLMSLRKTSWSPARDHS